MKLDLHGYKVHDAWKEFTRHISDCYYKDIKETEIITGHGKIAEEIIAWVGRGMTPREKCMGIRPARPH